MTAPVQNAVVVAGKQVTSLLRSEEAQRRIVPLLGAGADYERVVAEVWLAIQQNPKIAECAPLEIVKSTARAVSTGGIIGRDVYLVPFKEKLEVVEDYKFLAKMIVQAGGARAITYGVVYEGDEFDFEFGTEQRLRHVPVGAPGNRKITHAWALARVRFGEFVPVVLTRDEIDAVRRKFSKQWNVRWENRQKVDIVLEEIPWYALKTCVRRLAKLLPSNPRLAAALAKLGLVGDFENDEALAELSAAEGIEPAPMQYRLNPAYPGRALADSGDSPLEPGHQPRGLEVERRVITEENRVKPDDALLAHYQEGPDEYGTDELALDDRRQPPTSQNAQEL